MLRLLPLLFVLNGLLFQSLQLGDSVRLLPLFLLDLSGPGLLLSFFFLDFLKINRFLQISMFYSYFNRVGGNIYCIKFLLSRMCVFLKRFTKFNSISYVKSFNANGVIFTFSSKIAHLVMLDLLGASHDAVDLVLLVQLVLLGVVFHLN